MNRIDSTKNPKVKSVKRLSKKKYREREQQFVVEGWHLLEEVLSHEVTVQELLISENKEFRPHLDVSGLPVTIVTEQVMNEMSHTETPQGILAICRMPDQRDVLLNQNNNYLFVDGVQDPGNLGTIIRTADAVGITAVILGEGTVDSYNDKVIRATQGSLFHLPVIKGELEEWIDGCNKMSIPVFGTAVGKGTTHSAIASQKGFALLVGNEGAGVQEKYLEMTDQNIYVPIYGNAESLNVSVATGILLYHLKQTI